MFVELELCNISVALCIIPGCEGVISGCDSVISGFMVSRIACAGFVEGFVG
jgi:hypothetical protein